MDNLNYDFHNTGYKIHLPVVPDSNDPLTRKIADFLDQKFGLPTNNNTQYQAGFYKIGSGGELEGGKGITLYGRTQSMQEMQELAQEIEQKFGKELADNVKKYNINFEDPLKLSNSVQARFAVYRHGKKSPSGTVNTLQTYWNGTNPSGAIPTRTFQKIDGTFSSPWFINDVPEIDQKFWNGDSTMYAIDNFGELFTGKIENDKVPQFIMDGLPKEYLQHYNLTEKDIIARINNGTKQIVANMLEDVVKNPNSAILRGNPPWLATLDSQVIDEAKQLLTQYEPQTVQKLEQMLPQLEQKCPALSILKNTTPYSKIKIVPLTKSPINPVGTKNPINVVANTPIPPTTPVQPVQPIVNTKPNVTKLGRIGKIGAIAAGTTLTAGAIYALANKFAKKEEMKVPTTKPIVPKRQIQTPQKANIYCMYCGNPLYSYTRNGSMRV